MRKSTKTLAALVLGTAVVAGGTAFTAGNTLAETTTKGYGSQTITGVEAESVVYNSSASGEFIESVRLALNTDTRGKEIRIAFNDQPPATCSDAGEAQDAGGAVAEGETVVARTVYLCQVGSVPVFQTNKFALVAVEADDADYDQLP